MRTQVSQFEAIEAWVSGKAITSVDKNGNESTIESFKNMPKGSVVRFDQGDKDEDLIWYIKGEH